MFVIGFLSSSPVLALSRIIIGHDIVVSGSLWDTFTTGLSLGALLALCAVSAWILLWAYSKNRDFSAHSRKLVFGAGLFISLASAMCGVWFNLLQIRAAFDLFPQDVTIFPMEYMNYFWWGVAPVFCVNAIITFLLLRASRRQPNSDAPGATNLSA
jgi:heme A synthase